MVTVWVLVFRDRHCGVGLTPFRPGSSVASRVQSVVVRVLGSGFRVRRWGRVKTFLPGLFDFSASAVITFPCFEVWGLKHMIKG